MAANLYIDTFLDAVDHHGQFDVNWVGLDYELFLANLAFSGGRERHLVVGNL